MYTLESVVPALCGGLVVAGVIRFLVYCNSALDAEGRRG